MPDTLTDSDTGTVKPARTDGFPSAESTKYFESERLDEARKRFATYSLWAGLLGLLLLLVPNPVPWLAGPVAIVLGIHALIRIHLRPKRHAGTTRALVGIFTGLLATLACRWWLT